MQNRIFSTDSPKAIKASRYGYVNAIHYMAPATLGGVGDLCSHRSAACTKLCLGWESGQAAMVAHDTDMNSVRLSRIAKAQRFMRDRAAYLLDMVRATDNEIKRARRRRKKLCVRPNGSTDVAYEGIRFTITRDAKGRAMAVSLGGQGAKTIFDHYPTVQFVDYTKNPRRFARALPSNYHLTFSRSETNEAVALELLHAGHNVAVVFAGDKPTFWKDFAVVDGDAHDLRHLDPKAFDGQFYRSGYVIGLSPKGRKAKKDMSGFVVR